MELYGEQDTILDVKHISIEVYGKASIAIYLWEHILQGTLDVYKKGLAKTGKLTIGNLTFNFKSGPLFVQSTVPIDVEYLVLILNGRSQEKIQVSKRWLDDLPLYVKLRKVAVVLLGNEECENDWLLPYMKSYGGKIDIVFLVYDSLLVDDKEFFQWPLGVAQYRGFNYVPKESVNISVKRHYICNFLGTVYSNSSRSKLSEIIASVSAEEKCPVIGRKVWVPSESHKSLERYIKVVKDSDLTLCPVGINSECYRIYEALSLGSVPVVEDQITPGHCDPTPFRLFKRYKAPFIFIKDWIDLQKILKSELSKSEKSKRKRRMKLLNWYRGFREDMKNMFVRTIVKNFCT